MNTSVVSEAVAGRRSNVVSHGSGISDGVSDRHNENNEKIKKDAKQGGLGDEAQKWRGTP